MDYDEVPLEDLGVEPRFKWLVYSLCGLNNDPELLTTTDKLRVSCVEAIRIGYMISKYLGVEKEEFLEGALAVMDTEDNLEKRYH